MKSRNFAFGAVLLLTLSSLACASIIIDDAHANPDTFKYIDPTFDNVYFITTNRTITMDLFEHPDEVSIGNTYQKPTWVTISDYHLLSGKTPTTPGIYIVEYGVIDHNMGTEVGREKIQFHVVNAGNVELYTAQYYVLGKGIVAMEYFIGNTFTPKQIETDGVSAFEYLCLNKDGDRYVAPGETFTLKSDFNNKQEPKTLLLTRSNNSFTINFDSEGGSSVESVKIPIGNSYGNLPIPTKNGHTFTGWYNGATKVNASTVPTENTTLTAQWSANNIQFTAPSQANKLAVSVPWSQVVSTTPNVSVAISGASWLTSNGGTLSGIPPEAGTYTVTLVLTAPNYLTLTETVTLVIVPQLVLTNNPASGAIAYVLL